MSPTMEQALDDIDFNLYPVWWHDIGRGEPTARALLRRGYIREQGVQVCCGTKGHKHPGYMTITEKGRAALARAREQ